MKNPWVFNELKIAKCSISTHNNYDFSSYFSEGRSLLNILENIEEDYDKEFKQRFGFYMFDDLDIDLIKDYFQKRYNINFQEYIDWVVRKEDGPYSETRRRNLTG